MRQRRKREEKDWKTYQIKIKNTKFGKHNQKRFSHGGRLDLKIVKLKKIGWVELNPCNKLPKRMKLIKRIKFKLLKN